MWRTYDEFRNDQSREHQQELLDNIKANYRREDGFVFTGLNQLNDYTSYQFFRWLDRIWRDVIGRLAGTGDYIIHYQLADDSWKSAPLTREVCDRITANTEHNSFMFNDVNEEHVAFTLSGDDEAHTINTFKRFEIVRRAGRISALNAILYQLFGP
jgi:hypothetical protein